MYERGDNFHILHKYSTFDLFYVNVSFNCARCVKESLTFDHPQVHDHFLVIEDAVDVHPAAVRPAVCPPHIQDVQVHLSVQDVPGQPVPVLHLQHQSQSSVTML